MPPGHQDGDWPEWPARVMLTLAPGSIAERYGKQVGNALYGQFVEVDAADEEENRRRDERLRLHLHQKGQPRRHRERVLTSSNLVRTHR